MRLSLFLLVLLLALALDGPVMAALAQAKVGVAEAAARITWIGNTGWQAVGLIAVMVGSAIARSDPHRAMGAERVLRLAVACFLLILLTGLAVQGLKYVFGRPRPENLGELSVLSFAPLSFRMGWNAFPSGHATTMGALAVLAARIWPKHWAYGWGLGVLVGVSRVLVGKHYPSDIVAGLALGAMLAHWMLSRWQMTGAYPWPSPPATNPEPHAVIGFWAGLLAIPRAFGTLLRALAPSARHATPPSR